MTRPSLILASQSESRKRLLLQAGVPFAFEGPDVDEAPLKAKAFAEGRSVGETARILATAKARAVSARHENALVLGADQMLDCEGQRLDKARDAGEAKAQLRFLRGRPHRLVTAALLMRDGEAVWEHVAEAVLVMREFSDDFLESYCKALGPELQAGVGGYALEGKGAQLMAKVDGDFFGILGLPLVPLLAALRAHGVMPS